MGDRTPSRAIRGGPAPDAPWWAAPAGLALVALLSALDVALGDRVVIATVVLGPFVTALWGTERETVAVGVVAAGVAVASGAWHDNFGAADYLIRVAVVVAGAGFALLFARARRVLALDRRRFRLLAGAATIGDVSGSVEETVQRLGDLLVPALADVCVIDAEREHGVARLTVAASGPRAAAIEDELRGRVPAHPGRSSLLTDAEAATQTGLPAATSAIVVPLRARGRPIGLLTLVTTDASSRRYDESDLEFSELLSGRVALALDNAGLFSELESLEAQQTAALGSLAEAVTIQDRAGSLVYANEAAAHALGFASAAELLATRPQEIVDAYDATLEDGSPLRLDQLPGRRVLAGQEAPPLLIRAVARATGEERWRITKATAVRDRHGRPRLAVNIIEDVTEVKRAEIAQRFLAEAGAVLASSLDIEDTLAEVARLAVPELADWCGVSMPDEHGLLRSVAVAHVDPAKVEFARDYNRRYAVRLSDEGGAAQVMRDGASQVINEILDELLEEAVHDPGQRRELQTIGMRAVMLVPMVAQSGIIGVLSFIRAESARTFTPADLELAEELGRRAGIAVEHAHLYTERSHIARTLQASLLPDALPDIPGFEIASLYRPAGEENLVGGDFYDAFETAGGWMLVVGDVTGRGAEAAALTAQARYTLRTAATLLGDPVRAVEELNRSLLGRADLSICTVAVVQLTQRDDTTEATVICAGHPAPLLLRDGDVERVQAGGSMIGAWPDSTWEPARIGLLDGDVLVLHTDGVTDAIGEADRFGDERLVATLRGAGDAPGVVHAVDAALHAFERGAQADDTALLAVRRVAS